MAFTDLIDLKQVEKGLEVQNAVAGLKNSVERLSREMDKVEVIQVTGDGPQTVFVLSETPTEEKVILQVNGVDYMEGVAFTVARDTKTITWTATESNGGLDISSDWIEQIIAIYKKIGSSEDDWGDELVDPACVERYKGNVEMVEAPKLNTKKITNMKGMFDGCSNLLNIPKYNTLNVTNMQLMFKECRSIETIPFLDTSKLINMDGMFYFCTQLKSIPSLNTSNAVSMSSMFYSCSSLKDVPNLNTSSVTSMKSMFGQCSSLKTIPQLNTTNVTNMSSMFQYCNSLVSVSQLNTSNVVDMEGMFKQCTKLETIPLLDTSKVNNMNNTFDRCNSLKNISFVPNSINVSIGFRDSFVLTKESILSILNGLNDSAIGAILTLSSASKALLSDDEFKIATDKGWTIA